MMNTQIFDSQAFGATVPIPILDGQFQLIIPIEWIWKIACAIVPVWIIFATHMLTMPGILAGVATEVLNAKMAWHYPHFLGAGFALNIFAFPAPLILAFFAACSLLSAGKGDMKLFAANITDTILGIGIFSDLALTTTKPVSVSILCRCYDKFSVAPSTCYWKPCPLGYISTLAAAVDVATSYPRRVAHNLLAAPITFIFTGLIACRTVITLGTAILSRMGWFIRKFPLAVKAFISHSHTPTWCNKHYTTLGHSTQVGGAYA